MSNGALLPGFYYDRDKNRYFRLKPGEVRPKRTTEDSREYSSKPKRTTFHRTHSENLLDALICREYGFTRRRRGLHCQL
jgi:hypothetical protein